MYIPLSKENICVCVCVYFLTAFKIKICSLITGKEHPCEGV